MAMPLAEASAREGRRPGRLAAPPKMLLRSCSILFVDDDEAFSYAAAKVLRAAGYEVGLPTTTAMRFRSWRAASPSIS